MQKDKPIFNKFEKTVLFLFFTYILIFLLIMNLITYTKIVKADGSVNPQDVWAEYTIDDLEPWNSTGDYDDGTEDSDNNMRLSYFIFGSNWIYEIQNCQIKWTHPSGTENLGFLAYEVDGVSNAGALIHNETWQQSASTGWITRDLTDFNITSSEISNNGVYFGFWTGGGLATDIYRETVSQSYGSLRRYSAGSFPNAPDPLTGEIRESTHVYAIKVDFKAYNQTITSHNQYYGSVDDYTARYDINIDFEVGSSNRQIRITYPKTEYLINITYSNGGFWNASLSTSDYTDSVLNSNYRLITIPESTINSYGGEYRLFTHYYPYQYTFYGPYWENGTYYQAMDVSAHMELDTEIFEVEGTTNIGFNYSVEMFSFAVGSMNRMLYTHTDTSFYIFYPDDDYSLYEFQIDDYTGKVGEGSTYLECYKGINGTYRLIERVEILDVINDVPLVLVTSQSYRLQIRFSDDSTYVFGFFVSGVNPNPTISITELEFGEKAHTVYQYILAEATRPNATHIRMNYEDNTPDYDTTIVNFTVTYRNGTLAYNSSQSGLQSLVFNWYSADNETDYVVELWADHQYHGEIGQKWVLDYSRTFGTFPDLDVLGTWSFPSQNIFSLMISLLVAGLFSFGSMTLAPFMFMTFLSAFTYLGATTFTYTQLAIGFSLSIIFALAYREMS